MSSVDYYTAVADRMGGVDQVKPFYRLSGAGMMNCGLWAGGEARSAACSVSRHLIMIRSMTSSQRLPSGC